MNLSSLKPQRCIHRWSNLSVIGSLGILHTPTSRLPEQTQSGTQLHSSHWEKMDSESHTDSSCFPLGRNMQRFCSHLLASKSHGPTFYQDHKEAQSYHIEILKRRVLEIFGRVGRWHAAEICVTHYLDESGNPIIYLWHLLCILHIAVDTVETCHIYSINWHLIMYSVYFPTSND